MLVLASKSILTVSIYVGENVKDKDVIVVDDMVHSGKTLANTTRVLNGLGAANIYAFVTHNMLNQQSFQKVENLPIVELVTTNTISNVNIYII
jgi:ribose-phosphate pyrophosphokinase